MVPPRVDEGVFEALMAARRDRGLIALAEEVRDSAAWREHHQHVETSLGVRPDVRELVVADLSATKVAGFFGDGDRQLVLDADLAREIAAWEPEAPWNARLLHELLHACDTVPWMQRVARPAFWPGGTAREAERVITEGMTDQLTVAVAGLPNLGSLPWGCHEGAYQGECMTVGALALAIRRRNGTDYDEALRQMLGQPRGKRLSWAAGQLGLKKGDLAEQLVGLSGGRWNPQRLQEAVDALCG